MVVVTDVVSAVHSNSVVVVVVVLLLVVVGAVIDIACLRHTPIFSPVSRTGEALVLLTPVPSCTARSALGDAPGASDLAGAARSVLATSASRSRRSRSASRSHLTGSCFDAIVHRSSKETLFSFKQPTKYSFRGDETEAAMAILEPSYNIKYGIITMNTL